MRFPVAVGSACAAAALLFGITLQAETSPDRIVPIAARTAASSGVAWRTSLQIYNSDTGLAQGTVTYHPLGRPASESDPSIRYSLQSGEAVSYADVFDEASHLASAIGSLD